MPQSFLKALLYGILKADKFATGTLWILLLFSNHSFGKPFMHLSKETRRA